MTKQTPTTAEEAQAYAIEWQSWMSEQNLSIGELVEWGAIFVELATRFDLTEEYKENGII